MIECGVGRDRGDRVGHATGGGTLESSILCERVFSGHCVAAATHCCLYTPRLCSNDDAEVAVDDDEDTDNGGGG